MSASHRYQISDFLLFSREALRATDEQYQLDLWPLQVFLLFLSLFCLLLYLKWPKLGLRVLLTYAAASWLLIGLLYHRIYFQDINWTAIIAAILSCLQAMGMLVQLRCVREPTSHPHLRWLALTLYAASAFAPLTILWGNSLSHQMLFGWGPTEIAVGTIGILLLCTKSWRFLALSLWPALWLLIEYGIFALAK